MNINDRLHVLDKLEKEYSELTNRTNKLADFLIKQMNKRKMTINDNQFELLIKQYSITVQYADILAQRISLTRKDIACSPTSSR